MHQSNSLSISKSLSYLISPLISVSSFKAMVLNFSTNGDYANLRIDRQKGLDVRLGISTRFENSMLAQFSYPAAKMPNKFRCRERPFHIVFQGEAGIDAGGLMKDFATELTKDLNSTHIGAFIATPNAINHIGQYQECVVPYPHPNLQKANEIYKGVGILIAIAIRHNMPQQFQFPPYLWSYLADETLTIESVYQIDENYKVSVNNLTQAISDNQISANDFSARFGQPMLKDITGKILQIKGIKTVTKQNGLRYIASCHEVRLSEIKKVLQFIYTGFWDNLAILHHPEYLSADLLEYMACGDKEIDIIARCSVPGGYLDVPQRYRERLLLNRRKSVNCCKF